MKTWFNLGNKVIITRSLDMAGSGVAGNMEFNGAIDCAGLYPIVRYDDTINAQSTVALLQQIGQQHPAARILCHLR